eukprot:scaffold201305_cov70-Cyclotella_meneghiniana.AAC.8
MSIIIIILLLEIIAVNAGTDKTHVPTPGLRRDTYLPSASPTNGSVPIVIDGFDTMPPSSTPVKNPTSKPTLKPTMKPTPRPSTAKPVVMSVEFVMKEFITSESTGEPDRDIGGKSGKSKSGKRATNSVKSRKDGYSSKSTKGMV